MKRVEAREREAAVRRTALNERLEQRTDCRSGPHDVGLDAPRPVPRLVPRQERSGHGEPRHDPEQDEPEPPHDSAGPAVRARGDALGDREGDQDDEHVGREAVHAADDRAARHHERDVMDARPRALEARRVARHQDEPRHDLDDQEHRHGGAERVAPPRAAGNRTSAQARHAAESPARSSSQEESLPRPVIRSPDRHLVGRAGAEGPKIDDHEAVVDLRVERVQIPGRRARLSLPSGENADAWHGQKSRRRRRPPPSSRGGGTWR